MNTIEVMKLNCRKSHCSKVRSVPNIAWVAQMFKLILWMIVAKIKETLRKVMGRHGAKWGEIQRSLVEAASAILRQLGAHTK